jgi:hypothetical protein
MFVMTPPLGRDWMLGKKNPLKILAEREMTRSILNQTTDGNLVQAFKDFSLDPTTRQELQNSLKAGYHFELFTDTKLSRRSLTPSGSTATMTQTTRRRWTS